MAIKVGGTEVVDNNRQLKNIASVDATTVAALGAAGVGGGGGIFDMTATGAISAGDALGLNSNGTVSKIGSQAGFPSEPSQLETTSAYTSTASGFEITYDTAHDKFVVAFQQSGQAKVFAGTIGDSSSDTTPVIGTDATVQNKNTNKGPQIIYDSAGSGKHIMLWSYYESDSDTNCNSAVIDVTGSTPSVSSITTWHANLRANQFSSCYDADNANVVVAWQSDGGQMYIRAGTVSSGTVSWGNKINFLSGSVTPVVEYDPDSNQVILMFSTGGATRVIFYTVSGTTLTQLTEQSSNKLQHSGSDITTVYQFLKYEPQNNKLLITYNDSTNGGLYAQAATIGSNSITYGTRVALDSTSSGYDTTTGSRGTKIALKDATSGTFYVSYKRNNPRVYIQICSLSGTTVTVEGSRYTYSKSNSDIVYSPDDNIIIQAQKNSANTLSIESVKVVENTPLADAFIGFAGENISNAASGEVKLIGSVVTGLSGLTTGSNMYVTDSATFSTSSTNNTQVGKALSTSSLLITRPN